MLVWLQTAEFAHAVGRCTKGGLGDRAPGRDAHAADRRQRAHLLLVQQRTALDVARAVQESRLPRLRDGLVRRPGRRVRAQDRGSEPAVTWFGPGIRWQRVVFEARCRYRGAA